MLSFIGFAKFASVSGHSPFIIVNNVIISLADLALKFVDLLPQMLLNFAYSDGSTF